MSFNTQSRTVNASKNAISAFINKFCILCLTFVSRKFFIDYIGIEYLGIHSLFANVLTLLAMADLGLGTAMNVSLYKPIAENNTQKITALLCYFRRVYYFIAFAVLAIGLGIMPFLKYVVNMDKDIPHLYLYYSVFVVKSAISYLFVYKASIIKADQKNYLVNRIDVFTNTVTVILKIISILTLKSFLAYILLDVLCVCTHNFIVSHIANKQYPFIKNSASLSATEKKEVFTDISSIFIYKISWSLLNGSTNIIMSIIVGTIYVGMYANYYTITHNLELFVALFFNALTPSIGNLVATSGPAKRFKTFQSMQMVSFWICGITVTGLYFLTQDFIEIIFGKDLLLDRLTLVAIILNVFFSICMRPIWAYREGTGMYRQIRYIMFVTAILNIVLSIVLGYWIGIAGILFASTLSKFFTYFWYEPVILFKKFFSKKPFLYYWEYLQNAVINIICIILCYFALRWITQVSILNWAIKAAICLSIVNIAYFIRYKEKEAFKDLKSRVLKLVKKG